MLPAAGRPGPCVIDMTVTIHERLNLAQFQQGREGDSANGRADAAGGQEQEEQEEEQPQLQPQLQQQGSPQREQRGADHLSDLVQHKRPADQAYLEPPCTLRSPTTCGTERSVVNKPLDHRIRKPQQAPSMACSVSLADSAHPSAPLQQRRSPGACCKQPIEDRVPSA